jgi:hypothetical protein
MMVEYIICQWTFGYASNPDIVSHVGFAGTIVSIILAVIAIIYSFFQTFSQQRDAAKLSTQLANLAVLSNKLDLAGERIEKGGESLSKIVPTIEAGTDSARRTEEAVNRLAESDRFKEVTQNQDPQAPVPLDAPRLDIEGLVRVLFLKAGPTQLGGYGAIYMAAKKKWTIGQLGDKILASVVATLEAEKDSELTPESRVRLARWASGTVAGSQWILDDLDIIDIKSIPSSNKAGKDFFIEITDAFAKAVEAEIDGKRASDSGALINLKAALAMPE